MYTSLIISKAIITVNFIRSIQIGEKYVKMVIVNGDKC